MKKLLKNTRFLHLIGAEIFAVLSFSMFMITLSWFVVDVIEQPQYLGLIMAAASLPRMFTMVIGGVLADRVQKSKILFGTQITKALLIGVLLWAYLQDDLTISILLVVSFLIGCLDGFFFPALSSLVPALVAKNELQPANTLIHSSQELFYLIGPVIAGILLNYYSFEVTFAFSITAMAMGALLIFPSFIRDDKPVIGNYKPNFFKEFLEGYRYIRTSSIYSVGIGIIVIVNFFVFGPMFLSLPILAKETGGSALDLSFLEAGFSVGSLAATCLLLAVPFRQNRGRLIMIFLISSVIFLGVFSQITSLYMLIPVATMIGFFGFVTFIPTDVIIQEKTDPKMMGRVMSIVFLASTAFDPVSQALFSFLMSMGYSVRLLLVFFAVIGLLLAFMLFAKAKKWRTIQ